MRSNIEITEREIDSYIIKKAQAIPSRFDLSLFSFSLDGPYRGYNPVVLWVPVVLFVVPSNIVGTTTPAHSRIALG